MRAIIFLIAFLLLSSIFPKSAFAAITFTISNPTITGNDEIEVDAEISGLIISSCSTSGCYLQAELKVLDDSKDFFGYTYNNSGEYVDYFSSPSSTEEIKTKLFNFIPVSGAWFGKLKAKNNPENSNYIGPGQYTIRFRRFTGNSTSPTSGDSNTLTITLNAPTPSPSPTLTPTPQPTNTPTNSPTPTKSPTPTPTTKPTATLTPLPSPTKTPTPTLTSTITPTVQANVLGISQSNDSLENTNGDSKDQTKASVPNKQKSNVIGVVFISLGVLFLSLCGIVVALSYRNFLKTKTNGI